MQTNILKKTKDRPREHITKTLGKMILSGELPPGKRLPTEFDLGEQMAVSRTALRESVRMLAGKGLVESRARIGTVVLPQTSWNQLDPDLLAWREDLPPDFDFIRGLIEAREAIEPAAAALAAKRATGQDLGAMQSAYDDMCAVATSDLDKCAIADAAFHLSILYASKNAVFANFAAVINTALRASFRLTATATQNFSAMLTVHGQVLEAIRMRDSDAAHKFMTALIEVAITDFERIKNQ